MNNIFDTIYVINLKQHKLKKHIFLRNNNHVNFTFIFCQACDGNIDRKCNKVYNEQTNIKKLNKAQIGYIYSMIHIFQDAIHKNYNKILILEDDVIFCKNFNKKFNLVYNKIPENWEILRLGITNHNYSTNKHLINKNKDNLYMESLFSAGSWAICYKKSIFRKLIHRILKFNKPYDLMITDFFYNDYMCLDHLVIPDVYKSCILLGRNLSTLAKKCNWDLKCYNFIDSLRKVTIFIKNNKHKKYILQDLKIQTYKNFEIIIINNKILIEYINKLKNEFIMIYDTFTNFNNKLLEIEMNKVIKINSYSKKIIEKVIINKTLFYEKTLI